MKIFTGSAHPALGESIASYLGVPVGRAHLARFSDGEVWFQIHDNVRGADVFVVQPTCSPVNENLVELLLMLDAFKRSSASRLTAVMPVLRLRPPGPQGQAAGADLGQAGRRPALDRRQPTACSRSTCTPRRSRASSTCPSTTCSPRP